MLLQDRLRAYKYSSKKTLLGGLTVGGLMGYFKEWVHKDRNPRSKGNSLSSLVFTDQKKYEVKSGQDIELSLTGECALCK